MRRLSFVISLVVIALASPIAAHAEVKSVRMHIAGYLCGN